ncbi:MAG TPA: hypothetical protein VII82_07865 [Polyangiaceae bacterium]|jgi:hypothetical protein
MTLRFRWLFFLGMTAAATAGCSSSSSGAPVAAPDASEDVVTVNDDASVEDAGAMPEAAPAAICDAASLAPILDGGTVACFECQSKNCASELTVCSTDCACAPAYTCLQQNSVGGVNSGYSACPNAVSAQFGSNAALMAVASCATTMCNPQCFGGSLDGG